MGEQLNETKENFWYSEIFFVLIVGMMSSGVFLGTHIYYTYHVGSYSSIPVIALLDVGIKGGGYSAAAAFGFSFLFARVLEGPLVGILDLGGSILTGVGVGIPAMLLGSGLVSPVSSFPLAVITGAAIGTAIGALIIGIRRITIKSEGNTSTYGADIMMGAGNTSGRYLGPLIIISACMVSIQVGIGSFLGGTAFHLWGKPIAGGAIIGAMVLGAIFQIPLK